PRRGPTRRGRARRRRAGERSRPTSGTARPGRTGSASARSCPRPAARRPRALAGSRDPSGRRSRALPRRTKPSPSRLRHSGAILDRMTAMDPQLAAAPFRTPSLPVERRIEDLLERMTLAEKIAQLGGVWSTALVEGERFSPARASALLSNGAGQVTRIGG